MEDGKHPQSRTPRCFLSSSLKSIISVPSGKGRSYYLYLQVYFATEGNSSSLCISISIQFEYSEISVQLGGTRSCRKFSVVNTVSPFCLLKKKEKKKPELIHQHRCENLLHLFKLFVFRVFFFLLPWEYSCLYIMGVWTWYIHQGLG